MDLYPGPCQDKRHAVTHFLTRGAFRLTMAASTLPQTQEFLMAAKKAAKKPFPGAAAPFGAKKAGAKPAAKPMKKGK